MSHNAKLAPEVGTCGIELKDERTEVALEGTAEEEDEEPGWAFFLGSTTSVPSEGTDFFVGLGGIDEEAGIADDENNAGVGTEEAPGPPEGARVAVPNVERVEVVRSFFVGLGGGPAARDAAVAGASLESRGTASVLSSDAVSAEMERPEKEISQCQDKNSAMS